MDLAKVSSNCPQILKSGSPKTRLPFLMFVNILLCKSSLFKKLIDIDFECGLLVLDDFVHPGLSETRLIRLVVSLLPITDNINDNVCLELLSPVSSKLMDESDSFSVVSVDVEDGTIVGLANVCSIWCGSCETRVSSETDLIVDNDVDRSTPAITFISGKELRAVVR